MTDRFSIRVFDKNSDRGKFAVCGFDPLHISGTLSGNVLNAATQFNLGGSRILSVQGSENLFAGLGAGISNTDGIENAFFGRLAGESNNTGSGNSFFGFIAGRFTTSGTNDSIFLQPRRI